MNDDQKKDQGWTREHILALIGILSACILGVLAIVAAWVTPEARAFLGLEDQSPTLTIFTNATVPSVIQSSIPVETPREGGGMTITETSTLTSQPEILVETGTIGNSIQGRSLDFTRIGNGPHMIVVAGALHGNEPNAAQLVDDLKAYFVANRETIGNEFTFYFLPRLNPDGLQINDRFNANNVDLNRNWATTNWQEKTENNRGSAIGGGGSYPFSETIAFSRFLLDLQHQSTTPMIVFIFHSMYDGGLVQPSYTLGDQGLDSDPIAYQLAQDYAENVGYIFKTEWPTYSITGEAIHWCGEQKIHCMDIELNTKDNLTAAEVQSHLSAILKVVQK